MPVGAPHSGKHGSRGELALQVALQAFDGESPQIGGAAAGQASLANAETGTWKMRLTSSCESAVSAMRRESGLDPGSWPRKRGRRS